MQRVREINDLCVIYDRDEDVYIKYDDNVIIFGNSHEAEEFVQNHMGMFVEKENAIIAELDHFTEDGTVMYSKIRDII